MSIAVRSNGNVWMRSGGGVWAVPGGSGTPDILFDTFSYTLDRAATGGLNSIVQSGPEIGSWGGIKAINNGSGAASGGYIFTRTAPTGFSGTLPNPSGQCLVLEANCPDIGGGFYQTDFYIEYGNPQAAVPPDDDYGALPPEYFLQYWLYSPGTGSEATDNTKRDKFHYANATAGPGYEGGNEVSLGTDVHQLFENPTWTAPTVGDFFLGNRPGYRLADDTGAYYSGRGGSDVDKLGFNLANKPLLGDHWTLVRMRFNTSGSQGSWECWLRDQSESVFTKVAEWIGGVTTDFVWNTSANDRLGPARIRIPTTMNGNFAGEIKFRYFQDFAIATSADLLPVY